MGEPARVEQRAAFVAGASGRRFRLVTEPAGVPVRGTVVLLPAFAEEMNKSRRMAALAARAFARAGWRVVQRDLHGCGDSSGDFADASWAAWADDVRDEVAACDPLQPLWLWCIRSGALLAPAALALRPDAHLLLWQPALAGAQHLQQFLRLHAGARIVGSAKAGAGAASPAARLKAGQSVELGGYELAPALATGMEAASFELPEGYRGRVAWFELSADEAPTLSPAAGRGIERLAGRGVVAETELLRGPAFWQTQEIEECPELVARSVARLDSADGSLRHG